MRSLSLVLVSAVIITMCRRGTLARSLRGFGSDPAEWTHATELTVAKRTDLTDILPGSHNPCFSLRENEEERQLLCSDRRRKFNLNPFGLRFGKRFLPAGALARPRTITLLPVFLNPRDLEVTT